jgi:hypothetical protein
MAAFAVYITLELMATSRIERILEWVGADTVFLRSCMFLAGGSVVGGLAWAVLPDWPQELWVWCFLIPLACFGLALVVISLAASDERFVRYLDLMSDGGDLPVLIFFAVVVIAAVPLTLVVRLIKKALA